MDASVLVYFKIYKSVDASSVTISLHIEPNIMSRCSFVIFVTVYSEFEIGTFSFTDQSSTPWKVPFKSNFN